MHTTSMLLRGLDGCPRPDGAYVVEVSPLPVATPEMRVGHHVIVVDRSGSMYGDMPGLKDMLEKLLVVEEYKDARLRVTLISYSGRGDVITHFRGVAVQEVMAANSPARAAVRQLRVAGLTCVSQAMQLALDVARAEPPDHLVAVTLHSDGYFNDPSPTAEYRALDRIVDAFAELPHVFVNTVAHRGSADFKALASVSNRLSGVCTQATTVSDVYNALYEGSLRLAGRVVPTVHLPLGDADYQVYLELDGRLLGAAGDLTVRGVRASATGMVYRYRRISLASYPDLEDGSETAAYAALAFARAALSEGRLQMAKYAAVTLRDADLLRTHARALTGPQIAAFAEALDARLFCSAGWPLSMTYGLDTSVLSVAEVCARLDEAARAGHLEVDLLALLAGYRRQGLRRLPGSRADDGTYVEPWLKTVPRDRWRESARVQSFDLNRGNPTINMLTARPVRLVRVDDNAVVEEVEMVRLDELQEYRSYTVLGDGETCCAVLPLRITSQRTHRELVVAGVLPAGAYQPTQVHEVRLAHRLPAPLGQGVSANLSGLDRARVNLLLGAHALQKFLDACAAGRSDRYTPEQLEGLRAHYVSANGYVNLPTTVPYADREAAIARGEVDFRTSYNVRIGTPEVLHPGKLPSANAFLQRWYTVTTRDGRAVEKPTVQGVWETYARIEHKVLGPRVKVTAVDKLMARVFDPFLVGASADPVADLLTALLGDTAETALADYLKAMDDAASVEVFTESLLDLKRAVDHAVDDLYARYVTPLAFYVGATGLLPDELAHVPALDAEEFQRRHPEALIAKAEQEATFFEVAPGVVLTVFAESVEYTPSRVASSGDTAAV